MALTHTVGSITVTALLDGAGPAFLPRAEAFPEATAAQWAEADRLDPDGVTTDGAWWLPFRSFAIRYAEGPVILVDTGIGPAHSLAELCAGARAAARGVDRGRHRPGRGDRDRAHPPAHRSHRLGGAGGLPVHRGPGDRPAGGHRRLHRRAHPGRPVRPLDRAAPGEGRLQEIEGGLVLAPGVRIVPTPGHTPGHQSVWAYAGSESVLVTGDLLVHAVQLIDPDLAYASDMDPAQARTTRRAILDDMRARGAIAAVSHLGTPFHP